MAESCEHGVNRWIVVGGAWRGVLGDVDELDDSSFLKNSVAWCYVLHLCHKFG